MNNNPPVSFSYGTPTKETEYLVVVQRSFREQGYMYLTWKDGKWWDGKHQISDRLVVRWQEKYGYVEDEI